jgi:hypothetical protein
MNKRQPARAVTRAEFTELRQTLDECWRALDLQFHRIAQIQAELDALRAAWVKPERSASQNPGAERLAESDALLSQLRNKAEASKEERRVIADAMAERSAAVKLLSARSKQSATNRAAANRAAKARNRTRRLK